MSLYSTKFDKFYRFIGAGKLLSGFFLSLHRWQKFWRTKLYRFIRFFSQKLCICIALNDTFLSIAAQHWSPQSRTETQLLFPTRPRHFFRYYLPFKVPKRENFLGSDFEFCTFLLLVLLKYWVFVKKKMFWLGQYKERYNCILSIRRTKDFQQAR